MKFDDYKILSDRDYTIMKQNYDTLIQSETNDLNEILDKLYKQRQNLIDLNQNHKFDDMLEKIDNNISDIESIIGSNQKIASTKQSCEIPHYWGLKKPSKQDINSDNTNGNNSFSDFLDNEYKNNPIPTPTQPSLDNNLAPNIDITPPNNNEQPETNLPAQNTTKRNSPMQGSALSNIIKQLNVGAGRLLGKKHTHNATLSKVDKEGFGDLTGGFFPYPVPPDLPPHHKNKKRPNLGDGCEPHDIALSNQCDIVRLILLYMMLRPNCRYISRLSSVACDQFEILQLLI